MPLGQMQVDGRYFEVAMAEQDLDGAQVSASFKKVVAKQWRNVWDECACCRASASRSNLAGTPQDLGVTGWLDVCQRLPGKSHSFGLRRRPRQ